jgi:hypothetical protein
MSPQDFCLRTYCAIADVLSFDPVTGQLSLRGRLTDGGEETSLTVSASGVTQFRWDGHIKEPDGFFELTTVGISEHSGRWRVTFEPWLTSELQFTCDKLELNGDAVDGVGAWFQDALEGPVRLNEH